MTGAFLKMGTNALKTAIEEKKSDIDWEDYNYPPGLKIIHFKPAELEDSGKVVVAQVMHAAFLVIPVFFILNLTINVLGIFLELKGGNFFFHSMYSLFHSMIGIPLALGVFSKGYRTLAGISDERTWYKFGEIFLIIFLLLAFTFEMLCYHGIRNILAWRQDHGIMFTLGLIEESILACEIGLRIYCLAMVLFKYDPVKPEE